MQFDLVDGGELAGLVLEALQVLGFEVADADGADLAGVAQFEHRLEGVDVGVLLGRGPVDEVEVERQDRLAAEAFDGGVEGLLRRVGPLVVVPDLRREEDVAARHVGGGDALPDAFFVVVDAGGVDAAVADLQGFLHGGGCAVVLDLPDTEAQLRHLDARRAGLEGHGGDVRVLSHVSGNHAARSRIPALSARMTSVPAPEEPTAGYSRRSPPAAIRSRT